MERRKRDGVYYTPAWVTAVLVDATLGRKLRDVRRDHVGELDAHAARLEAITVLDPACGVGAFLIPALRCLLDERRWLARERGEPFDADAAIRAILSNNLYGVDIDAGSVETTKLQLGLHAAESGNIHTGDSLSGFDWPSAFPEVFARGGFDCILGNPPYVKYQQLRRVDVQAAERLRAGYESAASGNFDIYLPFIEKGIELLNARGRMGYIAPSLWLKHAYGEGLRQLVRRRQCLERWVDFGDLQVFEDATTYTALQFFVGWKCESIECEWRGSGDRTITEIPYASIPEQGTWNFLGAQDAEMFRRMAAAHPSLGEMVQSISVGVQTSADAIFHLRELAPGRYGNDDEVVEIEPAIMRPLVSGADVRRYVTPRTQARILFPYVQTEAGAELIDASSMQREFPKAWAYLRRHEERLRGREQGKFDDLAWYRFGRNQNIDKQHRRKVLVPRLVQHLALTPDLEGEFVADNVDVCYLVIEDTADLWYVLGVLNSRFADYYFRRTSKPFRGGYLSANKQYLAPIPVPRAEAEARSRVGQLAKQVWEMHEARAAPQSAAAEQELDEIVFGLYGLTDADITRLRSGPR